VPHWADRQRLLVSVFAVAEGWHIDFATLHSVAHSVLLGSPTANMPFSRKDAPPTVPDCETIEYLLGAPNPKNKVTRAITPLDEASGAQRKRKNLVRLGKRCTQILGDPFGLWTSRAGNVAHPEEERMVCSRRFFVAFNADQ
jgi:hypothetical protein